MTDHIINLLKNDEQLTSFSNSRFETYDVNNNGTISLGELGVAMYDIAGMLKLPDPTSDFIESTLKMYDSDNSKALDKNEFKNFVKFVLQIMMEISMKNKTS